LRFCTNSDRYSARSDWNKQWILANDYSDVDRLRYVYIRQEMTVAAKECFYSALCKRSLQTHTRNCEDSVLTTLSPNRGADACRTCREFPLSYILQSVRASARWIRRRQAGLHEGDKVSEVCTPRIKGHGDREDCEVFRAWSQLIPNIISYPRWIPIAPVAHSNCRIARGVNALE